MVISGGSNPTLQPTVVAVVGPTAAGKTALSVALAEALSGEVVNADSMQLYRGMDIGTAKITEGEKRGVPHHVFDVLDVTEAADVVRYQSMARAAIEEIAARGRAPILAGGSGLYVQAALDEMDFPGTDPEIRARLEAELEREGSTALWERLRQADPKAAKAILPSNGRRLVRALEVVELTGSFTASLPEPKAHYEAVRIGVDLDTAVLDERIERRVRAMWDAGLVDEVRELEAKGLREGRTASRALGYQQVLAFLAGECDEEEAFRLTVQGTRRFVRRQRSWFKRDGRIEWFDAADPELVERVLTRAASGSA
ncbi:tRNA (adenosine(37)-N6)-dimethylallyltransferase MiaA [Glycomyces sp. L485]|uniref:tRNA (adenosine(37)-N6)-dimethylallyltransferase MiaA n=1 Tax=Glycomyces sp. L485 TaxID=2909235 RepID=UPI001F4BB935|nr:tRNA (adenosine(37)-N6)-dimethylallyltransferase MiaA [Glycomyces sp. L485]MCH7230733.1 tRNA (adenosine(37)-N6)-dimethylallyltransferase MiaA [Glycomyces sp. L485]